MVWLSVAFYPFIVNYRIDGPENRGYNYLLMTAQVENVQHIVACQQVNTAESLFSFRDIHGVETVRPFDCVTEELKNYHPVSTSIIPGGRLDIEAQVFTGDQTKIQQTSELIRMELAGGVIFELAPLFLKIRDENSTWAPSTLFKNARKEIRRKLARVGADLVAITAPQLSTQYLININDRLSTDGLAVQTQEIPVITLPDQSILSGRDHAQLYTIGWVLVKKEDEILLLTKRHPQTPVDIGDFFKSTSTTIREQLVLPLIDFHTLKACLHVLRHLEMHFIPPVSMLPEDLREALRAADPKNQLTTAFTLFEYFRQMGMPGISEMYSRFLGNYPKQQNAPDADDLAFKVTKAEYIQHMANCSGINQKARELFRWADDSDRVRSDLDARSQKIEGITAPHLKQLILDLADSFTDRHLSVNVALMINVYQGLTNLLADLDTITEPAPKKLLPTVQRNLNAVLSIFGSTADIKHFADAITGKIGRLIEYEDKLLQKEGRKGSSREEDKSRSINLGTLYTIMTQQQHLTFGEELILEKNQFSNYAMIATIIRDLRQFHPRLGIRLLGELKLQLSKERNDYQKKILDGIARQMRCKEFGLAQEQLDMLQEAFGFTYLPIPDEKDAVRRKEMERDTNHRRKQLTLCLHLLHLYRQGVIDPNNTDHVGLIKHIFPDIDFASFKLLREWESTSYENGKIIMENYQSRYIKELLRSYPLTPQVAVQVRH